MEGKEDVQAAGQTEPREGSAGSISVKGRQDIHAEGGTRPREGQQGPFFGQRTTGHTS